MFETLTAEIIAIGSELLAPDRTDTNSLWLTEQLNRLGIEVKLKTIVGDDDARLEEAVKDASRRSKVVITTGGLGPTEDDITRKITARALGRRLLLDETFWKKSNSDSRDSVLLCLSAILDRQWSSKTPKSCQIQMELRQVCSSSTKALR